MADENPPTVRIRRPSRVRTDERGRTVWDDTVEMAELELVSTQQLQNLLASADGDTRSAIERAVERDGEGVLARDTTTGLFEIISDEDLQVFLRSQAEPSQESGADEPPGPASREQPDSEQLSLASTQMVRKILIDEGAAEDKPGVDRTEGFDPYNSR